MADARSVVQIAGKALDLTLLRQLAQRYGRSTLAALEDLLRK
jgi:hypothetical protein